MCFFVSLRRWLNTYINKVSLAACLLFLPHSHPPVLRCPLSFVPGPPPSVTAGVFLCVSLSLMAPVWIFAPFSVLCFCCCVSQMLDDKRETRPPAALSNKSPIFDNHAKHHTAYLVCLLSVIASWTAPVWNPGSGILLLKCLHSFAFTVLLLLLLLFFSATIISIFILHFIFIFLHYVWLSIIERIAAKKLTCRPGRIKKTIKGIENIIINNCNNSAQLGRFDRQNVE